MSQGDREDPEGKMEQIAPAAKAETGIRTEDQGGARWQEEPE